MKLSELKTGETAIIVKILGHGAFRKRVIEMGFVKGRSITAVLSAPLRDPIKYSLMGYEVSLRRSEARLIEVLPVKDADKLPDMAHLNVIDDSDEFTREYTGQSHTINIALIGNPNCGKTTLFNIASGAHEHVGNYSGVTVAAKQGDMYALLAELQMTRTKNIVKEMAEYQNMPLSEFVSKYTWKDFLKIKNSGKKTLKDLRTALNKFGYTL